MVAPDADHPDAADPLGGYSSISLFRHSLDPSAFPDKPNPSFDSLHSHLKSRMLRSPDKLVNQAKTILDGSSDLLATDKASFLAFKDNIEAALTVNDKIPKDRRPALGLKRAKFTAKSIPSQPDQSLEPSIDIDNLKEPDEFFAAFEKFETAKKEWRRQTGQPLTDLDQNHRSLHARGQRPSLMGKSATYKHRSYSSNVIADSSETVLSSQEAFDHSILSPTHQKALPETNVINISPHARVSGGLVEDPSLKLTGKRSDEVLSCKYDVSDQDEKKSLQGDEIHFELMDIGKSSLSLLPDVPRHEYDSSREALPKRNDKIFNVNGMFKSVCSKLLNVGSQSRESSVHHQVSPTLSKSPLASISLLNRHISKRTPSKDPFSSLDIDLSPVESDYRKQADQVDKIVELHESFRSTVHGEGTAEVSSPPSTLAGNGTGRHSASGEQLDEDRQSDLIATSNDSHEFGRPAAHREDYYVVPVESLTSPTPTSEHEGLADEAHKELNVEASSEDLLAFAEKHVGPISEPREQDSEVAVARESVQQNRLGNSSAAENPGVDGVEGRMDDPLIAEGICDEEPIKKTGGSSKRKFKETGESIAPSNANISEEPVNKARKAKAQLHAPVLKETRNQRRKVEAAPPGPSKVNEQLRRHSLFGAGTKYEAGLRRSTRIKMRPLEFWRGERFLYGRVHQSVVSVIGVKYASPVKDAKTPGVKVKSFVSDKYKDLVDLASLH